MSLKKFGTTDEPLEVDEAPAVMKTAAQRADWTPDDSRALADENRDDDRAMVEDEEI